MMNILNAKHAYNLTRTLKDIGLEGFEFLYTEFNTYTPNGNTFTKYLYVDLDNFSKEQHGTIGQLVEIFTAVIKKYFVEFYKVKMPKVEYKQSQNKVVYYL